MACATLALAGCGSPSPAQAAYDRAIRDARGQALAAANAIGRDGVWQADQYVHSAAQVPGVEVMRVTGVNRQTAEGVTLIIRVHGVADVVGRDGGPSGRLDLSVCFVLKYDRDVHDDVQGQAPCPASAPLAIPRDAQLPGDIEQTLRRVLPAGRAASEASVRTAVDGLTLDPRVRRDVATVDGSIGVALSDSQYDCVMARVSGATVDVWRPSRVQLAPGEINCGGSEAAGGEGLHAPH